jgi:predicted PurR-regulated permease PerM
MAELSRDLTRTVLAVLFLGGLILASVWILRPFLAPIIWATMIVVSTWPVMLAVQGRLWNRRWLAVTVMTIALLLVFVVPFSAAIGTIVGHADEIASWAKGLRGLKVPAAPEWVAKAPLVGERAAAFWNEYAAKGVEDLDEVVAPYAGRVVRWFVAEVGGFGLVSVQFLLTVVIAAIMYAVGESWGAWVRRFGRRLAGERGDSVVQLAGKAIRGVALGVVLTAFIQAMLTAVMFMLAVAQIGAVPVLVLALVWLWFKGSIGWFVALLVWTVIVGSLDNVLRPILIRRGADLPLLLIFAGVIGGLVSFGLLGLFVGPVILAVAYTLIDAWVAEAPGDPPAQTPQPSPPPAAGGTA